MDQFVRACFAKYYAQNAASISVPSLAEREFGFGVESKIDYRHKAFSSEREFHEFLRAEAPLYASYSTARYSLPAARPMGKKIFLGADVAFDLDKTYEHEHPEKHNPIACALCLARAKEDALRLYEEFLLGDFGFSKEEVKANFSGSKGFHFHVRSAAVQQLSSNARKQLCDYAEAFEISPETIFRGGAKGAPLTGPSASSRGWAGKIFSHVSSTLSSASPEALAGNGISKERAATLLSDRERLLSALSKGNWDYAARMEKLWFSLLQDAVRAHRVELDKPVSFDLARLIRIPNTLHGSTGLLAAAIADPSRFEPLSDAVAFKAGEAEVECTVSCSVQLMGEEHSLKEGRNAVPLAVAVLLCAKGAANAAVK